jgi:DtxR family manganese transport transcriptional regulator
MASAGQSGELFRRRTIPVGVPTEAAEQDAEGLEHHVSDATLAAFGRFLRERG